MTALPKIPRMPMPKAGRHSAPKPRLKRPKMSVIGKSEYGAPSGIPKSGPPMAFPASPGPDNGGAPNAMGPPMDAGGAPPVMGPGGGPPEL